MQKFFLIFCLFLLSCQSNSANNSTRLRIGINREPITIDPRKSFANDISNIMMFLYDGLMQFNKEKKLSFGLAKKVDISEDKKIYTFTLRDAKWSDGSTITAFDFEKSWKTILKKDFPSVYPHKFYMIENAQKAKSGEVSLDKVGINALNSSTLQVKLKSPCPYFLEQLAYCVTFAVHKEDSYFETEPKKLSFSGPFILENWKHNNFMILKKNPHYWAKEEVKIEEIMLNIIDSPITLLNLFESNEIDFVGGILSPLPHVARQALNGSEILRTTRSTGTVFLEFNHEKFPFTNINIRKAFSFAIDRRGIEKNICNYHGKKTQRLVPSKDKFSSGSDKTPNEYLEIGLQELGCKRKDLNISYLFNDEETTVEIAQILQQNWREELGVLVKLEKQTWRDYIKNFTEKNYQLFKISWICDVNDPIFLLNIYRLKFGNSNKPRWENKEFLNLLEESDKEFDENRRLLILKKAENLLLNNCIIAPIFHTYSQTLCNPNLINVQYTTSGYIDFRWASFK